MHRDVFWAPTIGPGVEHLHLIEDSAGVTADSVMVGTVDGAPFRVRYEIECDREYRVQRVRVVTIGEESKSLTLRADATGGWTDGRGGELPALDGCIDVDISVTPFTNTLPIRRLDLDSAESVEIPVAYVSVPELRVEAVAQRYTCLDSVNEDGGRYRYESVSSDFTAELPVDGDGLVVDYPELFARVSPS